MNEIDIVRRVLAYHQQAYAKFHNAERRGVIESHDMAIGEASVELAKMLRESATPAPAEALRALVAKWRTQKWLDDHMARLDTNVLFYPEKACANELEAALAAAPDGQELREALREDVYDNRSRIGCRPPLPACPGHLYGRPDEAAAPACRSEATCTNCGKQMTDAMRFCSRCWNDAAIKDTVAQAKINELERAAPVRGSEAPSETPGTDLARWIWCRFVGIPITEPYDGEFRMLLLKIAAYTDEIKQRESFVREAAQQRQDKNEQ